MQERKILQLDQAVVNRIAAGEVVQRPVNAVKEIVENALDAGATQVTVTVKDGGYKLLQVQDNGHGIQEVDLPLLCVRHATSKLRAFEDLESMATLGFRGEALASISFVAHLTVTTMTPGAAHGWRAAYRDGELQEGSPQPCAAVPGTIIQVEDLFFNMATRRKALKSTSEEYARILDMLQRYAVHVPRAGFTCKRQGEARVDLHSAAGSDQLSVIRTVYGAAVAKALLPLTVASGTPLGDAPDVESSTEAVFEAKGWVSSADYAGRKTQVVLFVNGRPVEWRALRRGLEAVAAAALPKTARLFVYLEVRVPGRHVDVNVHPTKHEVALLHGDALVGAVAAAAQERLAAANTQRTFTKPIANTQQAGLPQGLEIEDEGPLESLGSTQSGGNTQRKRAGGDHKLVRTDHTAQTLHRFFSPSQPQLQQQSPLAGTFSQGAASGRLSQPSPLGARLQSPAGMSGGTPDAATAPQRLDSINEEEGAGGPGGREAVEGAGEEREGGPGQGAGLEERSSPAEGPGPPGDAQGLPLSAAVAHAPRRVGRGVVRSRETWDASQGDMGLGPGEEDDPAAQQGQQGLQQGQQAQQAAQQGQQGQQQGRRAVRQRPNPPPSELASIAELLAEVDADVHTGLLGVVRCAVWVGLLDDALALVQGGTRLYALALPRLTRDLFYQQVLRRWERCAAVRLEPPLPLRDLLALALRAGYSPGPAAQAEGNSVEEVADTATRLLVAKAPILADYVGIRISAEGLLETLPALIEGYDPPGERLPLLALALARDVDWSAEKACFRSLAQVLADFFCWQPSLFPEQRFSYLPPELRGTPGSGTRPAEAPRKVHSQGAPLGHLPAAAGAEGGPGAEAEEGGAAGQQGEDVSMPAAVEGPEGNASGGPGAGREGAADNGEGQPPELGVERQAPEEDGQLAASREPGGLEGAASAEVPGAEEVEMEVEEGRPAGEEDGGVAEPAAPPSHILQEHQQRRAAKEWVVEHVLLPAMRAFLKPPTARGADGSAVELTRLEKLYKVFERC